jgi:hypothetical protein
MNADKIVFNKASDGNYATTGLSGSCVLSTWNDVVAVSDTLGDRIDEIEQKIKKPDVDPVVKTNMVYKNGGIYVKHYEDGFFQRERWLIPDITDVRVYDNTVVVKFADRTKTSAVLDSEDTFSLEQGISICITKKLLGEDGNSLYNKMITRALKVIKKKENAAEDEKKKKEADKKARELKKARAERRKAKKREETISIHAEAFKRAFENIVKDNGK